MKAPLEYLKAYLGFWRRTLSDIRRHKPDDFAAPVKGGRTQCRFLLCQVQSPIPTQVAMRARTENLKFYAKAFEDILIKPGQLVSLFHILRISGQGIRGGFGPHFDVDRVVKSVEAGLGQLASTLYNLALIAGLDIVEHHAAKVPPKAFGLDYILLGAEACVRWPFRDLRFRNNLSFDLALQTQVASGQVVATLYGKQALAMPAHLVSEVIATEKAPDAAPGERAFPAQRVRLTRAGTEPVTIIAERQFQPIVVRG